MFRYFSGRSHAQHQSRNLRFDTKAKRARLHGSARSSNRARADAPPPRSELQVASQPHVTPLNFNLPKTLLSTSSPYSLHLKQLQIITITFETSGKLPALLNAPLGSKHCTFSYPEAPKTVRPHPAEASPSMCCWRITCLSNKLTTSLANNCLLSSTIRTYNGDYEDSRTFCLRLSRQPNG